MLWFPVHGEFLQQGGRRKCLAHEEKPWWLHINDYRSEGQRNQRAHD